MAAASIEFVGTMKRQKLVVVGNGMVGHRLLQRLREAGAAQSWEITVFCEEPRLAYDRVNLSKLFEEDGPEALSLVAPGEYEAAGIQVLLGDRAIAVDRTTRTVTSAQGRQVPY